MGLLVLIVLRLGIKIKQMGFERVVLVLPLHASGSLSLALSRDKTRSGTSVAIGGANNTA